MEALQKELDLLEAKKKELLEKIEGEKPILRKELAALLGLRSPTPFEHHTCYLASGLGMTTIEPFPPSELEPGAHRGVYSMLILNEPASSVK